MSKYTYKDHSGVEQTIDKYHVHELLDRLHIMQNMWEEIVQNHPACESMIPWDAERVQKDIGKLYQYIGRIEFDEFSGGRQL